ncbi:GNAT family N-acetyltransferase [Aquipuribacter sp. SD81]|uniref:GNAT family N-acetyltransferase n=1 Tax=Aquipuribacter sp. SD81 TaxID=3127703 RepID=UPI00301AFEEB
MSWESLAGDAVDLAPSPSESDRFGVTMARLTVGAVADPHGRAPALAAALAGSEADVVVVRHPAAAGDCAAALAASDRDVLPAGALVYWELLPARRRPPTRTADLVVVAAGEPGAPEDLGGTVEDVVRASFTGYANHYTVDPLLDDDAALAGYVEWARRATTGSPAVPDARAVGTLVLVHAGSPVGVATTSVGADDDDAHHVEVLLAGLGAPWQGRGWYPVLLDAVAERALEAGARRVVISTQVHNVRVQRAWARLGLEPFAAVETVHAVRRGLLAGRR